MSANDFCVVARQFATEEYTRLYVQNILRVRKYGASNSRDRKLLRMLEKATLAGVSETPYESRNSERYFEECALKEEEDVGMLMGNFGLCEQAASEYVDVVELCSTVAYFMAYNENRNGIQESSNATIIDERGGGDQISFTEVQRRARLAGVSLVPFETKRSSDYQRNLALLLRPIYLFA